MERVEGGGVLHLHSQPLRDQLKQDVLRCRGKAREEEFKRVPLQEMKCWSRGPPQDARQVCAAVEECGKDFFSSFNTHGHTHTHINTTFFILPIFPPSPNPSAPTSFLFPSPRPLSKTFCQCLFLRSIYTPALRSSLVGLALQLTPIVVLFDALRDILLCIYLSYYGWDGEGRGEEKRNLEVGDGWI